MARAVRARHEFAEPGVARGDPFPCRSEQPRLRDGHRDRRCCQSEDGDLVQSDHVHRSASFLATTAFLRLHLLFELLSLLQGLVHLGEHVVDLGYLIGDVNRLKRRIATTDRPFGLLAESVLQHDATSSLRRRLTESLNAYDILAEIVDELRQIVGAVEIAVLPLDRVDRRHEVILAEAFRLLLGQISVQSD